MKDIIPTVKITNFAGVTSIKDGMKGNVYSKIGKETNWIPENLSQQRMKRLLMSN